MRDRRKLMFVGAAALALVALKQPSADIRVVTHDAADPAPHQVKAAVDLGLMAVSVLVTWTARQVAH